MEKLFTTRCLGKIEPGQLAVRDIDLLGKKIRVLECPRNLRGTYYDPFNDEPDLFLKFAELGTLSYTDETDWKAFDDLVLKFANRYGSLGGGLSKFHSQVGEFTLKDEKIVDWMNEANAVATAVTLLNEVLSEDRKALRQKVKIAEESFGWVLVFKSGSGGDVVDFKDVPDISRGKKRDVVWQGRVYLSYMINQRLKPLVEVRLVSSENQTRIEVIPFDLIGSIWLQIAYALTKERKPFQCLQCGTWFYPTRSDALTCSVACRQAKRRKKE